MLLNGLYVNATLKCAKNRQVHSPEMLAEAFHDVFSTFSSSSLVYDNVHIFSDDDEIISVHLDSASLRNSLNLLRHWAQE